MTKHTILFLAADPGGTNPRALDREARSIRAELKRSGYRDRFELVTQWAAEPLDLLRELRELRPAVVHFSGHGGQDGLFFQAADGRAQVVSPEAIAETFGAAGAPVKLVVLSACYSVDSAGALLAHVDCVVGMSGAIHDDAARSFAIGFYGALGEHESIAAAYLHGRAAISLEGLPDLARPQLKVRDGRDASQLILAAAAPPARVELPCPYPGMRPYSADDADHFHGRGAEIDELLGRLRTGEREIYVIGPSGSGKSSLVAAGVLPRLARGVAGLGPFLVRSMRPGEHPAARLDELLAVPGGQPATPADAVAALLAHRGPGASVLIVIDQLEELFTLAAPGERAQFLLALGALRTQARCVVIFTLRADFFGAFMESPLWTDRRGRISRVEVGPLRDAALREAIVRPAQDLGVRIEPELIERLLADAGSELGVLPLLQETLVQLWDRRQDQRLTLADYQALGDSDRSGLAVALSRRADATLRALPPAQEAIARRILLRLVSFGEGRSDTRRQQPRSKLRAAGDEAADFEHVLQRMITDRLLATDEDAEDGEAHVDLAHEVMLTAWPTLADWIHTHRADEQRRRQLEAAAAQWVALGRGAGGLLDPIELADAEAWQRTDSARELGQSADVAALVAASRAAHDRQRRRRRGLVWSAFAALAVFAAVVAILAVMARHQASEAEDSRQKAEDSRTRAEESRRKAEDSDRESQRLLAESYQEAGRQLLIEEHPQEAMAYFIAAFQKGEKGKSLQMLISTASRALPLLPPLEHQGRVRSALFSPDGSRIVTASDDHTARIWDAATGKPLGPPLQHQGWVRSAAFSSDGSRIVTSSFDQTARVWDAATGRPLTPPLHHQGAVRSAAFTPDGFRVVTTSDYEPARVWDAATGKLLAPPLQHQGEFSSAAVSPDGFRVVTTSEDEPARVWDVATGKPLSTPLQHWGIVSDAEFSPNGSRIVTVGSDQTARIWDSTTGKPLTLPLQHQHKVYNPAFSPDGSRIVTASFDRTARVWNVATGTPVTPPLLHQGAILSAAFSPDSSRVVTSNDQTAQVWDAATGQPLTAPFKHQAEVWTAAFSPDGSRVVTASDDHSARVWDAATDQPFAHRLQHQGTANSVAFSPDGTRVITASFDQTARIWDARTGKPLSTPLQHQGGVSNAAFSPDGTRVVTASKDNTARVWNTDTGKPLTGPLQHQGEVQSAVFSFDGTRVVTASKDQTARVWDAVTGKPLAPPLQHQGEVSTAAFSPNGSRIVTATILENTTRIWDAATGKPLTSFQHQGTSAAFNSDGSRVVTAGDDTARVWDAATGKLLILPLQHQGAVVSAAFNSDGTRVVTASFDKTARVWDAATGKLLVPPLQHKGAVVSAAFSSDGSRVVTASFDRTAGIWDAATGKPLAPPLQHHGAVWNAAFSPDGSRVISVSAGDNTRVWDARLVEIRSNEWPALIARSPFVLSGGMPVLRASLARGTDTN